MKNEKMKDLLVNFGEKTISDVSIVREEELREHVMMYFCDVICEKEKDGYVPSFQALPILVYPDGTVFTLWDWQGDYPANGSEVADFDWQLETTGTKAIILDGLPRVLG